MSLSNRKELTKKERDALPDEEFGIPSIRAFPLHDEGHVLKAIQLFRYCEPKYRKELARNIEKRAIIYNIKINKNSLVAKCLDPKSPILREDNVPWQDNDKAYNPEIKSDIESITDNIDKCKNVFIDSDPHVNSITLLKDYVINQKETVSNDDAFIFLGDICDDEFNQFIYDQGYKQLATMNGRYKIMVIGNNDTLGEMFYKEKCGFHDVVYAFKYKNYIFSHCPIEEDLIKAEEINVHGHIHQWPLDESMNIKTHYKVFHNENDFKPIKFTELVKRCEKSNTIEEGMNFISSMSLFTEKLNSLQINKLHGKNEELVDALCFNYENFFNVYSHSNNIEKLRYLKTQFEKLIERISRYYLNGYIESDIESKILSQILKNIDIENGRILKSRIRFLIIKIELILDDPEEVIDSKENILKFERR